MRILCLAWLLAGLTWNSTLQGADNAVWIQSRLQGSPEPPAPYRTERIHSGLALKEPVELAKEPGTGKLHLLEAGGRLIALGKSEDQTEWEVSIKSLDSRIARTYGMAFHPDFQANRRLYLFTAYAQGIEDGTRILEVEVSSTVPPKLQLRRTLVTWLSGGHNGGSLQFGPDGFLYISAGDGEVPSPPDPRKTGQDLSDLLSSILRIDVNQESADAPCAIPEDNPFRNLKGARPEIWAFGLRNPWRMSFDSVTGQLWTGDVGWEKWEMVFRVERGGNYGWSVVEGPQPVHPEIQRGPGPIQEPIVAYPHGEGRSVSGGIVYRGTRHPDLDGWYIYGDYVSGLIWGIPVDARPGDSPRLLARTGLAVICFDTDRDGHLLVADYGGSLHRLIPQPQASQSTLPFPTHLSDTGLFANVKSLTPNPGVREYTLRAEPWMDGARAIRHVALPRGSLLETFKRNRFQQGELKGRWKFPEGGILVRTLLMEGVKGFENRPRRLETQVLLYSGDLWNAFSYHWLEDQSDAVLAPNQTATLELEMDHHPADGLPGKMTWHLPSRTECFTCHKHRSGVIQGFLPEQSIMEDPDRDLLKLPLFAQIQAKPEHPYTDPRDPAAPLSERARTYLQLNCHPCHHQGGGGTATIDLDWSHALEETGLIGQAPSQGGFGILDPALVKPGHPEQSVLFYRMATTGPGRMPHFGSTVNDPSAPALVAQWIRSLEDSSPAPTSIPDLQEALHGDASALEKIRSLTTSQALLWIEQLRKPASAVDPMEITRLARHVMRLAPDLVAPLFAAWLPAEERALRGPFQHDPAKLVNLAGSAIRGRQWLLGESGANCLGCHRLHGRGREVGPDLSHIGAQRSRNELLQSILTPGAVIEEAYRRHTWILKDGQEVDGLKISQSKVEIVVRTLDGQTRTLAREQVASEHGSALSAMPEGLMLYIPPTQLADLVAYLESLK